MLTLVHSCLFWKFDIGGYIFLSTVGIWTSHEHTIIVIFFPLQNPLSTTPPRPDPTPQDGPQTDLKRTRNGPQRTRNGPQQTRNRPKRTRNGPESISLGWDGGEGGCRDRGCGGGLQGKKKITTPEFNMSSTPTFPVLFPAASPDIFRDSRRPRLIQCCKGFIRHRGSRPHARIRFASPSSRFDFALKKGKIRKSMSNRCQIDPGGGEGTDSRVRSGGSVPNKPLTNPVQNWSGNAPRASLQTPAPWSPRTSFRNPCP